MSPIKGFFMENRYYDNGSTSFPKPQAVATLITHYLNNIGGTYGRSAYPRVLEASGVVENVRELIANRLGVCNPEKIVFTENATTGINTILFGMNLQNSHILISPLEHNAVMRPILELTHRFNITYEILPYFTDGLIDIKRIGTMLRPSTRLVIINHQSNVNGLIQPIRDIKEKIGEIPMLVDLAQSLGHSLLSLENWGVDFAAFTGHKGLLGPTGTGGIYIKTPAQISPYIYGGTGSRSESFEMPSIAPDKFEAGTPNVTGIYGLLGALNNYPDPQHQTSDFFDLLNDISKIKSLHVLRAVNNETQGPLFSITHEKHDCSYFAEMLLSKHGIETRPGLHCAPLAHKTLGTFPSGTVRIAPSVYHTKEDFEYLIEAITKVSMS
jgi:cysteine desulfurase family protein